MTGRLSVAAATVRYGAVTAVDAVTLDVADHQTLALLGPSGCGKSTLLRAVAGLEPLSAGRITMDGTDLATVPVFRRRFGLMFQDGVLFGHRTVAGNIGYGLRMAGAGGAAIRARVDELLELVGLPGYGDRRVATLSGGQAQRVALARALAPHPRLLLLDEPLAALDAALREQLLVDLRRILTETGTPTIFVTHDQDEAFAVADRVAVMRDGRIRQQGTPREVWDHPADGWLAGFVGYSTVLSGAVLSGAVLSGAALPGSGREERGAKRPAGFPAVPAGAAVALRPAALRVDAAGDLAATVITAVPGPESTRLEVELTGWGRVHAIAGPGPVPTGVVRLRFDPAGAAILPAP